MLRHTFASNLAMNGVSLLDIKEFLGHRDIKSTLRYAHLMPCHKHKALSVLDAPMPKTDNDEPETAPERRDNEQPDTEPESAQQMTDSDAVQAEIEPDTGRAAVTLLSDDEEDDDSDDSLRHTAYDESLKL